VSDYVEEQAQKLADLTGRPICCVEVKRGSKLPAKLLMEPEHLQASIDDFYDSLGEITYIYPQEPTQ